jgi:hypothetical protein
MSLKTISANYEKYKPYLLKDGRFKSIHIDTDEIEELAKVVINQKDRERVEREQGAPKFGKEVFFFSTEEKNRVDGQISELYRKQENGGNVTVLNSLYASGNEIVPWLYFFIVLTDNRQDRIIMYFIKRIDRFDDRFNVIIDVHHRRLSYMEALLITDTVCVQRNNTETL